jgi:hypothetical protein
MCLIRITLLHFILESSVDKMSILLPLIVKPKMMAGKWICKLACYQKRDLDLTVTMSFSDFVGRRMYMNRCIIILLILCIPLILIILLTSGEC